MAALGHRILPAFKTEGDTWDSAWLADDKVYLQFNDGMGFLRSGRRFTHNGVVELFGTPEDPSSLTGINLNPGTYGDFLGDTYSTGIYEVGGILYQNLAYSIQDPPYYLFYNGSTIKSIDKGANWTNHLGETNVTPPNAQARSMYPDERWNQANFIKYGRGGTAPDVDNALTYVYLNSRNKDAFYLARIRREDISSLATQKLEYYKGGDGLLDRNWSQDIADWVGVRIKNASPPTTVVYNYGLRRYLSIYFLSDSWSNPPVESSLGVLEAPHPWGPWTLLLEENVNNKEGDNLTWSYLLQKFTSIDGKKMWATVSGRRPYGLQFLPVYLTTHPVYSSEAEAATVTGAYASSKKEGYFGSGYVTGFDGPQDKCVFSVTVSGSGTYILKIRYNTRKYHSVDLVVNGARLETLRLGRSEQQYATWTEMSVLAWLEDGDNTIGFVSATAQASIPHRLDQQIDESRAKLANLLVNYTEKHPDVIDAKRRLEDLERERERDLAGRAPAGSKGLSRTTDEEGLRLDRLSWALYSNDRRP